MFAKLVASGTKNSALNAGACYDGWFPILPCVSNGYNPNDGWGFCERFGITIH